MNLGRVKMGDIMLMKWGKGEQAGRIFLQRIWSCEEGYVSRSGESIVWAGLANRLCEQVWRIWSFDQIVWSRLYEQAEWAGRENRLCTFFFMLVPNSVPMKQWNSDAKKIITLRSLRRASHNHVLTPRSPIKFLPTSWNHRTPLNFHNPSLFTSFLIRITLLISAERLL